MATHDVELSQLCEQRMHLDAGQLVKNDFTSGIADSSHD